MVGVVEGALLQSIPRYPVVLDFIIHLRRDTGLSVSAVEVYSSARNSVLALKSRDLASCRDIRFFFVVSRDELCPPAGAFLRFFRASPGLRRSLYGHAKSFLARKLFLLALALATGIGVFPRFVVSCLSHQGLG